MDWQSGNKIIEEESKMEEIKEFFDKIKTTFNRYPKLISFGLGFAIGAYFTWKQW